MNRQNKKDRFLELRIKGETFQSIANILKVSKQTLINWSKEVEIKQAIQIAMLMKYQELVKQYQQTREERIKFNLEIIRKVNRFIPFYIF